MVFNFSPVPKFPLPSKIHGGVERDCPGSARSCDAAEIRGIDVGVRVAPYRSVQDIDCVCANLESLSFVNPDSLSQGHIQIREAGTSNAAFVSHLRMAITSTTADSITR